MRNSCVPALFNLSCRKLYIGLHYSQARSQDCQNEEADRSSAPPLPFPLLPSPPIPLEVGPLNPARGSGSAVSSPSGVWGGAPVEIDFGAF